MFVGILSLVVTVVLGPPADRPPHGRVICATQGAGRPALPAHQRDSAAAHRRRGRDPRFAVWARDYREQKRAELELGGPSRPHLEGISAPRCRSFAGGECWFSGRREFPSRGAPLGRRLPRRLHPAPAVFQAVGGAPGGNSFGSVAGDRPLPSDQVRPVSSPRPPEDGSSKGEPGRAPWAARSCSTTSRFRHAIPSAPLDPGTTFSIRGPPPASSSPLRGANRGAGKSTLFRLALGLERAFRRCGVLRRGATLRRLKRQAGAPAPARGGGRRRCSSIRREPVGDNIIGDHEGRDRRRDAWQAARLAARRRATSRRLPMGMLTPRSGASASVTSGGRDPSASASRTPLVRDPSDPAPRRGDETGSTTTVSRGSWPTSPPLSSTPHRDRPTDSPPCGTRDRIYVLEGRPGGPGGDVRRAGGDPTGCFRDLVRRQMA